MSQSILSVAKSIRNSTNALYSRTSRTLSNAVTQTLGAFHRRGDRRPWKLGYSAYRTLSLERALADMDLLGRFALRKPLPEAYGYRLDARLVEIPWVLSRLRAGTTNRILDAGSSLNYEVVINSSPLRNKQLIITTLAPERRCYWQSGVSYLFDDLRNLSLRSECVDAACCISTIEHIGMDNMRYAAGHMSVRSERSGEFLDVIDELKRVLRRPGRLLITFPFGRYEDHGWFQQFDSTLTDQLIARFAPMSVGETVYKYLPSGWQLSDRAECASCEFFDVTESKYFKRGSELDFPPDFRAGEGAVMCLELEK